MNSDESTTFQYVKLEKGGRRYFCLQQNVAALAWILLCQKDAMRPVSRFRPQSISPRVLFRWLRHSYSSLRRDSLLLFQFIRLKYEIRRGPKPVELPVYGHICAPVHKGYKVFNVVGGVVRKIYDRDVETSDIAKEIDQLRSTSRFDFAPRLKEFSISERWYEEEYLRGSPDNPQTPPNSGTVLRKFQGELVQHLNRLILIDRPLRKPALYYVKECLKNVDAGLPANGGSPMGECLKTKAFLHSIVERLRAEMNRPIFLVFTHGDFIPDNMVNTRGGIRLVDWEGAGYRSALFDFYSFFFYRAVCRDVPIETVASEIGQAFSSFVSQMSAKDPALSASAIELEDVYRRVFYVEQICGDMRRTLTDKNLNIGDFISRHIDAYRRYEQIVKGKTASIERAQIQTI